MGRAAKAASPGQDLFRAPEADGAKRKQAPISRRQSFPEP